MWSWVFDFRNYGGENTTLKLPTNFHIHGIGNPNFLIDLSVPESLLTGTPCTINLGCIFISIRSMKDSGPLPRNRIKTNSPRTVRIALISRRSMFFQESKYRSQGRKGEGDYSGTNLGAGPSDDGREVPSCVFLMLDWHDHGYHSENRCAISKISWSLFNVLWVLTRQH